MFSLKKELESERLKTVTLKTQLETEKNMGRQVQEKHRVRWMCLCQQNKQILPIFAYVLPNVFECHGENHTFFQLLLGKLGGLMGEVGGGGRGNSLSTTSAVTSSTTSSIPHTAPISGFGTR